MGSYDLAAPVLTGMHRSVESERDAMRGAWAFEGAPRIE